MNNRKRATTTNKDKIMNAAIKLFHLHGYDATSVDMLLQEAGVSRNSFYYHFESKEQLGLKVLEKLGDDLLRLMSETMLNPNLNPLERLVAFYNNLVYSQSDIFSLPKYPGCFFGNMALEQSYANEKFRGSLQKIFEECEETVEECIKECVKQGFFHDNTDPGPTSRLLISQFEGAILMAKLKNSITPLEEVYEEMKKLLVKKKWWHIAEDNKI